MKELQPSYHEKLETLASVLVTPERFGKLALASQLQLEFSDTHPTHMLAGAAVER